MVKIKSNNFFCVQGWMVTALGLKGNALMLYSIIYGFSQTANTEFTGSVDYLCEWLGGVSRPTVINTLNTLVQQGLLEKSSTTKGAIIYNRYTAVITSKNFLSDTSKEILSDTSKNFLPNNIVPNKIVDKQSLPNGKEGKAPKQSYNSIFSDPENEFIKDALVKFVGSCKGRSYNPKVTTVKKFADNLREYSQNNTELAMMIVDQSINKGWKDIYPLKDKFKADAVSKKFTGETAKDESGKELVY